MNIVFLQVIITIKNLNIMAFKWKGYFPDKEDEFYKYIKENGSFCDSRKWRDVDEREFRNWTWKRKHPVETEFNYITSKQIADELYKKALAEAFGERMDQTKPVALPVKDYNELVQDDAWEGGYVETLGYVEVAASSLYGNSVYLSSWVACGEQNNPVALSRFYELSRNGQWRGGYVGDWGYVSNTQHIPGSSLDFESVESGEGIIGCIVNVQNMIVHGGSVESVREKLKPYYNANRNEYVVENNDLFNILNSYFIVNTLHGYKDVNEALSNHKVVMLRVNNRTEIVNGETRKYGNDFIVLASSLIKSEYTLLDTVGCKVATIRYRDLNDDNCVVVSLDVQ